MNKTTVQLAALLLLTYLTGAHAQTDYSPLFNPQLGQLKTALRYQVVAHENQDVKDQPHDLSFVQKNFDLFLPLRHDDQSELALTLGVGAMDIATQARLTDADVELPDHLWNIRIGATYRKKLDADRIGGLMLELGSPSDKPFETIDEISFNATAFLRVPDGQHNAWLYFLNFATNRDFLPFVPIPGIGYYMVPSRQTQLLIGVPMATLRWAPIEKLTFTSNYFIPRTLHARPSYDLQKQLQLYAAFDWQNQRYFRADRHDDDDRLSYYEKKATAGIRCQINPQLTLDLHAGYAFDRFFYEGEDYDDRDQNRITLADGPFAGINAAIHF